MARDNAVVSSRIKSFGVYETASLNSSSVVLTVSSIHPFCGFERLTCSRSPCLLMLRPSLIAARHLPCMIWPLSASVLASLLPQQQVHDPTAPDMRPFAAAV